MMKSKGVRVLVTAFTVFAWYVTDVPSTTVYWNTLEVLLVYHSGRHGVRAVVIGITKFSWYEEKQLGGLSIVYT